MCLEGASRDFIYASNDIITTLAELFATLSLRYGISQSAALTQFYALRQKPGETARSYADRLVAKSYSTGLSDYVIIHHFENTLANPRLRELLATNDFDHLQSAVELATMLEHTLGTNNTLRRAPATTSPTTTRSSVKKCFNCGALGHVAAICPKPKRNAQPS